MDVMRAAVAVALPLSMTADAAAQNVDTAHRLCATAGNAQPPVYLTMRTSGLSRLELSPSVPGGIAQIAVSREEIATLCTEGLDVRYREPGLLPVAFSIARRRGAVYGNLWSAATTPDGATAQWLMIDVQSVAYARQREHAPIALFLDAQRLTATPPAIVGNGMVEKSSSPRTAVVVLRLRARLSSIPKSRRSGPAETISGAQRAAVGHCRTGRRTALYCEQPPMAGSPSTTRAAEPESRRRPRSIRRRNVQRSRRPTAAC
jgi:hypothetical protein